MVFFFIACHKKEASEEQMEQTVKSAVTGGQKPLGDIYNIQVPSPSPFLLNVYSLLG
jgi:hypothetical protein